MAPMLPSCANYRAHMKARALLERHCAQAVWLHRAAGVGRPTKYCLQAPWLHRAAGVGRATRHFVQASWLHRAAGVGRATRQARREWEEGRLRRVSPQAHTARTQAWPVALLYKYKHGNRTWLMASWMLVSTKSVSTWPATALGW